jgi:hypothetical protein
MQSSSHDALDGVLLLVDLWFFWKGLVEWICTGSAHTGWARFILGHHCEHEDAGIPVPSRLHTMIRTVQEGVDNVAFVHTDILVLLPRFFSVSAQVVPFF